MKSSKSLALVALLAALFIKTTFAIFTSDVVNRRAINNNFIERISAPDISTSCNLLNFSGIYNYNGIVASGYLSIGAKGNSALAYTFYGRKDVTKTNQLKNYPTVLWLNGGPGGSSQKGNLQGLGPLSLSRKIINVSISQNNYTWANNYNLLFIDQPVGTGLSYADMNSGVTFSKTVDQAIDDLYRALFQLYNGKGCFSNLYFGIPASNPLVIFGQGYGGKFAAAIGKKITEAKQTGGFLTGLKGVAIGNGLISPFDTLSQVGTYSYHLGLIDLQERMKLQKILLNASRHNMGNRYNQLHQDFDNALNFIQKQASINTLDIRRDKPYEELLADYFRNPNIGSVIYKFNPDIIFDQYEADIYQQMYDDFMKSEINRVQYLLNKKIPVLIYHGQDDLVVQTPGTMKWVQRLYHSQSYNFNKMMFSSWTVNNKVAGVYKQAGYLELRIVFNAGHYVVMDRPEQAMSMASSFINRITM